MVSGFSSRKRSFLVVLLALGIVAVGIVPFALRRFDGRGERATLRFAQLPISYSAVTQIAEMQGYFQDQGLEQEVISFPAGPDVVTALRGGSTADVGGVAITPVVTMIAAGEEPVILATTLISDRQAKLVTYSGNGITELPSTLKGKRIGVVKNTVGEIYLFRLLGKGNLRSQDVVLVNGRPADLRSLLVRGEIDAAILWDPFVVQAEREYRRLLMEGKTAARGDPMVVVDPTLYTLAFNVVTTRSKLLQKKDALVRMLRATIQAEAYIRENPRQAQAALEEWMDLEPGDLGDFFASTEFRVQLNVPQVGQWCKDELEWLREARPDTSIPENFSPFIDASLLRSIDPARVHE